MTPLFSFILFLSASSFTAWSQKAALVDSNNLMEEILLISRNDSAFMEKLMSQHTFNGVLDKEAYNEALKQQNPTLYLRMQHLREIFNELESQNEHAMRFIDHLLITARHARDGEISQPRESETIVNYFYTLEPRTQEYLARKFPPLRSMFMQLGGVPAMPMSKATSTPINGCDTMGTVLAMLRNLRISCIKHVQQQNKMMGAPLNLTKLKEAIGFPHVLDFYPRLYNELESLFEELKSQEGNIAECLTAEQLANCLSTIYGAMQRDPFRKCMEPMDPRYFLVAKNLLRVTGKGTCHLNGASSILKKIAAELKLVKSTIQ